MIVRTPYIPDCPLEIKLKDKNGDVLIGSALQRCGNTPPTVQYANIVADKDQPMSFQMLSQDMDSDTLYWVMLPQVPGLTISNTGMIMGTPTDSDYYTPTIYVTDGFGGEASVVIDIAVVETINLQVTVP